MPFLTYPCSQVHSMQQHSAGDVPNLVIEPAYHLLIALQLGLAFIQLALQAAHFILCIANICHQSQSSGVNVKGISGTKPVHSKLFHQAPRQEAEQLSAEHQHDNSVSCAQQNLFQLVDWSRNVSKKAAFPLAYIKPHKADAFSKFHSIVICVHSWKTEQVFQEDSMRVIAWVQFAGSYARFHQRMHNLVRMIGSAKCLDS